MTLHIDARLALDGMQMAIAERGEGYVYEAPDGECLNWHPEQNEPGCIVGFALYNLGVSANVLNRCRCGSIRNIRSVLSGEGVTLTNRATKVFAMAQVAQDHKAPWGAAYAVAFAMYNMETNEPDA